MIDPIWRTRTTKKCLIGTKLGMEKKLSYFFLVADYKLWVKMTTVSNSKMVDPIYLSNVWISDYEPGVKV